LFHADEQTRQLADITKLIVDFRNFANASKNEKTDLLTMYFGYTRLYIKSVKPPTAFVLRWTVEGIRVKLT